MNESNTEVPDTHFSTIGYFFGKQSSKHWLVSQDDLNSMYKSIKKGNILLWCDKRSSQLLSHARDKIGSYKMTLPNNLSHESEVDNIVSD